ncbi:class I SAM-dependent methyltransferase [Streptomyces coeruleoprunus]|uniref:Class I SAM-dependent methyltransferase n=1 Tax=Streptomyces coeruleoprunus TaxID=285563 RepID=A0ABV9X7V6_9ACTN
MSESPPRAVGWARGTAEAAAAPPGTAGYGEAAARLAEQYESVSFEEVHREALHLFPAQPCAVLDIGAGSGRDAAALAGRGHRVAAVEPTPQLRELGRRLHAGRDIEWIDDALPRLSGLHAHGRRFDLILLTAVWMHLDEAERRTAMPRVAALLRPGGRLMLSLRHGPVPAGRRMFDVPAEEAVCLAAGQGLRVVHESRRGDLHGREDVWWSRLVLEGGTEEGRRAAGGSPEA